MFLAMMVWRGSAEEVQFINGSVEILVPISSCAMLHEIMSKDAKQFTAHLKLFSKTVCVPV